MAMKVFNLACDSEHVFEGWFASADAYDEQNTRRQIECPVCASHQVRKLPSAPRLNLSGADDPSRRPPEGGPPAAVPGGPATAPDPRQLQQMFLKMARQLIASTEDVGTRFAEEARKIHYNEAPARPIRGAASREVAAELRDEGIEVFSLPLPDALKGPLQ